MLIDIEHLVSHCLVEDFPMDSAARTRIGDKRVRAELQGRIV
jgi:hypothetical protein